jgi:hypothetical protein
MIAWRGGPIRRQTERGFSSIPKAAARSLSRPCRVLPMRARRSRQPGLRIEVIELSRYDQRRHEGGAVGTAFGASEEPGLAAQGKAAQRALRRVVCQADPSVVDEAGEPVAAAHM